MSSARPSPELLYFTERGSGPPLLLAHGPMVTGEMSEPVTGQLAARHLVIVPDLWHLPGHLGAGPAAAPGYSHGGTIAQQLALDHPRRCGRLMLACTYVFNMATPREWLEGHLAPYLLRVLGTRRLARLVASQAARRLGKDRAGWLAALIADHDRDLTAAAWRKATAFDSRPRLAQIACPVLVVAGSDDRAVPIHHAEMLHDDVPGSQLVIIDGAGHALIWTHPSEFVTPSTSSAFSATQKWAICAHPGLKHVIGRAAPIRRSIRSRVGIAITRRERHWLRSARA